MAQSYVYSLVCFLLLGILSRSFGQAIVLSESWEVPSQGPREGGTVAGWRITGSVDIMGDGFGMYGPSHSGAQALELNGSSTGAVSTNISTTPGRAYRFSFAYSKNAAIASARAAVKIDDSTIHTIVADQTNTYSALNWRLGSVRFVATAATHEFTLQSLEAGNAGVYLDTLEIRVDRGAMDALVNSNLVVDLEVFVRGRARLEFSAPYSDAVILYTLNGSEPSANGNLYTGAFNVNRSAQVKAISYSGDFSQSAALQPFQLSILPEVLVTTDGGGGVSLDPPSGPYFANSGAVITATPDPGWTFLGWMGDIMSTEPVLPVTVSNTLSAIAVFGTTLSNSVIGSGSVTISPSADMYPFGTRVQATAIPQNSFFVQWGGDATGTNNPQTLTITNEQVTMTALFAALPGGSYSLGVLPVGQGRVLLSPYANRYIVGTNVSVTAISEPNQTFVGWSGDATGTNNPIAVPMTKNKIIHANFSSRPFLRIRPPLDGQSQPGCAFTIYAPLNAILDVEQSGNLAGWIPTMRLTNVTGRIDLPHQSAPDVSHQFCRTRLISP